MSEPAKDVSEALVASWRERTVRLQASIDADPQGEWAWLWKIRIEILRYLLSRHTEGYPLDVSELRVMREPARGASELPESPRPYDAEQLPPRPTESALTLAPQDLGTLRERLSSIRAANEKRHQLAEANREAAIGAEQRTLMFVEQDHKRRMREMLEQIKQPVSEEPMTAGKIKALGFLPPDEHAYLMTYANEIEACLTARGDAAEARPTLSDDEIADILSGKKT